MKAMNAEGKVTVVLHAATDVGLVRHNNEDNFLVLDLDRDLRWTVTEDGTPPKGLSNFEVGEAGVLLAVSDGMGGALAGEVASQLAVNAVAHLTQQFQKLPQYQKFPFSERLRLALEQANSIIYERSRQHIELTGMGATFTSAAFHQGRLYLAQVGDSRAYLLRSDRIKQLTKDQSLVHQLVEAGYLTEEQAERHAYRNVILQALGAHPNTVIVIDEVELYRGDFVLVCSDGLSNKVAAQEMFEIVSNAASLHSACAELIQLANERGGEDNITLVLAHFSGSGLPNGGTEEPTTQRIERHEQLPDAVEPELLDDPLFAVSGLVRLYEEEETQDAQEECCDVPADDHYSADGPDLAFSTSDGVMVLPKADVIGKKVSVALLVILFLLFLGAVVSALWYFKLRNYPGGSPAEQPTLALGHLPTLIA
jgi:protein phosphatase